MCNKYTSRSWDTKNHKAFGNHGLYVLRITKYLPTLVLLYTCEGSKYGQRLKIKVKVKLSPCLTKHHTMKMYGGVEA
jgi:hypothetical protein